MSNFTVSKSDFATMVGVSPAAITKAIASGDLAQAVTSSRQIDAQHPDAIAYAARHQPQHGGALGGLQSQDYDQLTDYLEKFGDMTVNELLAGHSTTKALEGFVKAAQIAFRAYKIQLDTAVQEGKLINVELCRDMFVDPIFRCLKQLLSDGATRITRDVIPMVQAGEDEADIIKTVEASISSFIRPAKDKMLKGLEAMGASSEDAEDGE